ncbi:unnamed protein product, partial [Didymodactylos carnosus]
IWKEWIENENFDNEREECMGSLLATRNWNTDDVENLLNWKMIPRTSDGWFLNTKHKLQLNEQTAFAKVIGITLNGDTGEIDFLLAQANKMEHNLFDMYDVVD